MRCLNSQQHGIIANTSTAALFILQLSSLLAIAAAFSTSTSSTTTSNVNVSSSSCRRTASTILLLGKKASVDDLALLLGLNVVPKNKQKVIEDKTTVDQSSTNSKRTKTSKGKTRMNNNNNENVKTKIDTNNAATHIHEPTIQWGKDAHDFFWGDASDRNKQNKSKTSSQAPQWMANEQEFPLYLLRDVLPSATLKQVVSLVMDNDRIRLDAEEMEQHELVNGVPRALRRSLVSRLGYSYTSSNGKSVAKKNKMERNCSKHVEGNFHASAPTASSYSHEILDMISLGLPTNLAGGMGNRSSSISTNHEKEQEDHPYEDGSVVYYPASGDDFYDTHHDSYDPRDPPRKQHRAYTILLYLHTPTGVPLLGGTEFPRLYPMLLPSQINGKRECNDAEDDDKGAFKEAKRQKQTRGLVMKPKAGDALVWPNFDRNGKPCMDSIHRALSLSEETQKRRKGHNIGKVVVNLWFEGRLQ